MPTAKMKLLLEYDDFTPHTEGNCLKFIDKCVNKYPDIIFNLFTTPYYKGRDLSKCKLWCSEVRDHINNNNIVLGVHGYDHSHLEFSDKNYEETIDRIVKAEDIFREANLDFAKVFRFPFWACNRNSAKAVLDFRYNWYLHNNDWPLYRSIATLSDAIEYNWNLNSDYNSDKFITIAHGHTTEFNDNGIQKTFYRIERLINEHNPEFIKFL